MDYDVATSSGHKGFHVLGWGGGGVGVVGAGGWGGGGWGAANTGTGRGRPGKTIEYGKEMMSMQAFKPKYVAFSDSGFVIMCKCMPL